MRYYDADNDAVGFLLDEMQWLLTGDQAVIFDALRAGVSRQEIACDFGISKFALKMRIQRIYNKIRCNYHTLDLPSLYDLDDLF